MGRVLVKSALPGKVLVKFDDDYEYAYDANNNIVLVQSPKSRGRPATRGERVASVVGNVAGVGRSLLQPADTFSQFLSNLRTGAQLGGQDARSLFRNFGETRGARIRADNRQAAADKRARQNDLFRQAVKNEQIKVQGPRFGGTSQQQRENALADLSAAQDTVGQRRREMQELGAKVYRDAQPTGADPSDFYGKMKTVIGGIPQVANRNRIDALPEAPILPQPRVDLPSEFALQNPQMITDIQDLADFKPMPGQVSKPSGTVKVVNAGGEMQGDVGTPESMTRLNTIQPPSNNMGAADANEEPIPTTTTVNTPMDKLTQMKPEPVEEEEEEPSMSGSANPNDKLMNGIMAKLTSQRQGAGP